jgi:hypothetical protein
LRRKQKGKKFIAYNKSFGTSSMKWHIEFEHVKLLTTYVAKVFAIENVGGSQSMTNEGGRSCMEPTKKCPKIEHV